MSRLHLYERIINYSITKAIKMNSKRNKLGVMGHPIKHSLSAVMHNAVFRELGLDYTYKSFDVIKEHLEDFIDRCKEDFLGLNVTIPHKVEVMKFLDEINSEAQLIGAVNTIKFENETAKGFNTDGIGCVKALQESNVSIKDKKILILGAGGAARAISFQLVLEGADVSISNRKQRRYMAEDLSRDVKEKLDRDVKIVDFSINKIEEELRQVDILINATPVGMFPNINEIIIPVDIIPRDVIVMDIVYNPVETRLLREAKMKGCKVVNGVGMFVHQGAESLRIWLGIKAPIELMRKTVLEKLK